MTLPAARVGDAHVCPMVDGVKPHVGGPIAPPCGPTVLIGGMAAARLADMAVCAGPLDVIAKGASTVLINGLPAVRLTDVTVHGGVITAPGEPMVLIGDPAFTIPANFNIKGDPAFQNKLIRDLYFLSTTPTGRALLQRLEAAGQPITFVPTNADNGYCSPESGLKARLGLPTGSVIQYNPDFHTNVFDSAGNMIAEPPPVILGHEMRHALANSEGDHKHGQDPNPPASQPTINEEEAQTIGTGSHSGEFPNENSLRDDLGLPRRDNHFGATPPQPGEPPRLNLRPGDP
jgi:uncharacterized Zn-binding protein involved in type VI secretion